MKIAILETGRPPARLSGFPGYGRMSADLIGPAHACTSFDVQAGSWPDPSAFDAVLVTGSAAGVYDPLPWIASLIGFLRALPPDRKLIGLCFGHQIMAEAYGGRAEKSERGWGLGLHRYDIHAPAPFMDDPAPIAVPVSHQDQVTRLPAAARVIGGNAHCPNGVLAYADRAALSFQCHPEFAPDYARALVRDHRAVLDDPGLADRALASLDAPHDSVRVGGWIRRFLEMP